MKRPWLILPCLLLGTASSVACGPHFPTMYAVHDLADTVLSMPRGSFAYELQQLTGLPAPRRFPPGRPGKTPDREADELCEALHAAGVNPDVAATTLDTYHRLRTAKVIPVTHPDSPLHRLPPEFLLYAKGAAHYHHRQWTDALATWEELLALPPEQRHYRSTWAAYMSGKVYLTLWLESATDWDGPASGVEGEMALPWFERTRELADAGFADSLDLAWSSQGDQARIAFLSENYLAALHGYLAQYRIPTEQADNYVGQSLKWTAVRMFAQPPERLVAYAADPEAAPVLSAYLLSRKEDTSLRAAWMEAVTAAGLPPSRRHVSRLAWLAYNSGDIEAARRLIGTEHETDPMARWLQAKLALWDGDTDRAIAILESLADIDAKTRSTVWARGMLGTWWSGTYNRPYVDGELGLLYLARADYDRAMDAFLRSGLWSDAAYVAEQVMTAGELDNYLTRREDLGSRASTVRRVESYWPEPPGTSPDLEPRLRYLLARRWMRVGHRIRALEWYPDAFLPDARELDRWLTAAEGVDRSDEQRAVATMKAAYLIRRHGMELLGTEIDPDWRMFNGSYRRGVAAQGRLARFGQTATPPCEVLQPTFDEVQRIKEKDVANSHRFHYRNLASDMMWKAAQALPDNDIRTAEALYFGGVFIKERDPSEADVFYKALVNRCRKLPIGQEADRRRWFPPQFSP